MSARVARQPDSATKMARRPSGKLGKLPVSEPASFKKFFLVLAMHICRKMLLVNLKTKFVIYGILVVVVSLITDLFPLPVISLALKTSFLNVFFARFAWGWTLFVLGPFMYITSYVYCCGNFDMIRRHLSRLAVATVWWYICTGLFDYVEAITGLCSTEFVMTKRECRASGGTWSGFDISGHTFLMIYNLFVIGEEVKVLSGWDKIRDYIFEEEHKNKARITEDNLSTLKDSFEKYLPYVRMNTFAVTMLSLIWELTLLITLLYYHNMPQKALGAFFAGLGWVLTYHVWYKQDKIWSPGTPGDGVVKYNEPPPTPTKSKGP